MLERLHRESGLAIVMSTHDLNLAAGVCRTLVLVQEGRVLASGPAADVLTKEHVRALYGVDADIIRHPSGRRLIVGLRRSAP